MSPSRQTVRIAQSIQKAEGLAKPQYSQTQALSRARQKSVLYQGNPP